MTLISIMTILCSAMYSNTLSAIGFVESRASGHPEALSTETNVFYFPFGAFRNGPEKSAGLSSFGFNATGSFPNSF